MSDDSLVMIGGKSVDMEDPCAMALALKKIRLKIITGNQEEVVRFEDDEMRFTQSNLKALDREIERYQTECARKTGTGSGSRRARNVRWA